MSCQAILESLDSQIAELQAFRDQIAGNRETIQLLETQGCSLQISPFGPSISAALHNQPGFTFTDNPGLFSLLEALEEKGFQFLNSSDGADLRYRAYAYQKPNLSITLFVFLAEDASACQRVIVGYEEVETPVWQKIERPIYKFQC